MPCLVTHVTHAPLLPHYCGAGLDALQAAMAGMWGGEDEEEGGGGGEGMGGGEGSGEGGDEWMEL